MESKNLISDQLVQNQDFMELAVVEKNMDSKQAAEFQKGIVELYLNLLINRNYIDSIRSLTKPVILVGLPPKIITANLVQDFSVKTFFTWLRDKVSIFQGLLGDPDVGRIKLVAPPSGVAATIQRSGLNSDRSYPFYLPPPQTYSFVVGLYEITMHTTAPKQPRQECSGIILVEKNQTKIFTCDLKKSPTKESPSKSPGGQARTSGEH